MVLNGRGFVGRSLVLRLLELGQCIVRVTDSTQSLQLDPSESNSLLPDSLSSGRAEYHQVDVRDISQIKKGVPKIINTLKRIFKYTRIRHHEHSYVVFRA